MKKEKAWQNKKAWKLYKENWRLAREIVALRDGYKCQIPNCCNNNLQLDHVFSREIKTLFFELGNLGYLCNEHHTHKSFRHGQWVDMMVKDICKERQGSKWWDEAIQKSKKTLRNFRTVYYQEMINEEYKKKLNSVEESKIYL